MVVLENNGLIGVLGEGGQVKAADYDSNHSPGKHA
jgi:hypothetical protein